MPGDLTLADGLARSGLSWIDLWLRYVGVGGCADTTELRQIVARDIDPYEHNLVAVALNEYFLDLDLDHPVAYRPSSSLAPHPAT